MNPIVLRRSVPLRWSGLALVLPFVAFLPGPGLRLSAEPAGSPPQVIPTTPIAMRSFVILFRRDSGPLTDTERQRIGEETAAWARLQNEAGHKLEPRLLAPESVHRGAEAGPAGNGAPVSALLFLEARDLTEAAEVAGSHPAVRLGFRVEVRPWAPPGAPAPTAPTAK